MINKDIEVTDTNLIKTESQNMKCNNAFDNRKWLNCVLNTKQNSKHYEKTSMQKYWVTRIKRNLSYQLSYLSIWVFSLSKNIFFFNFFYVHLFEPYAIKIKLTIYIKIKIMYARHAYRLPNNYQWHSNNV